MARSRGRPERRTFYISCTDEQWAEAKGRAAAAGMKTSPWLVERALNADLSIFDPLPEPERLALGEKEQDMLADNVDFMADFVEGLFDEKAIERLGNQVAFICDVKATEMIADGRTAQLFMAFEKLVGPENAERLLAKAVTEWHEARSVEVKVHGPMRRA